MAAISGPLLQKDDVKWGRFLMDKSIRDHTCCCQFDLRLIDLSLNRKVILTVVSLLSPEWMEKVTLCGSVMRIHAVVGLNSAEFKWVWSGKNCCPRTRFSSNCIPSSEWIFSYSIFVLSALKLCSCSGNVGFPVCLCW